MLKVVVTVRIVDDSGTETVEESGYTRWEGADALFADRECARATAARVVDTAVKACRDAMRTETAIRAYRQAQEYGETLKD